MAKKEGPSPRGARAGRLPRGSAARNDEGERTERLQPNKNREAQVARTGGRKLFDKARRKVFLEWFAATPTSRSRRKAGHYKTPFKHREVRCVAADWDRALQQGMRGSRRS